MLTFFSIVTCISIAPWVVWLLTGKTLKAQFAPKCTGNPVHSFQILFIFRAIFYSTVAFVFYNQKQVDSYLHQLWNDSLRDSWFLNHESCEPVWATICFAIYAFLWLIVDYFCPFLLKYRIKGNNTDKKDIKNYDWGHWTFSAVWYLIPILGTDLVWKRRMYFLEKNPNAPTLFQLVFQVSMMLFFYDVYFITMHMISHNCKFLYKMHKVHHMHSDIRAIDGLRFHAIDFWFSVIPAIWSVNTMVWHPLSRIVFNATITYLVMENHSGFDFPWSVNNIMPWFGGSRIHSKHHEGTTNQWFCQNLYFMDYLIGTHKPCSDLNVWKACGIIFTLGCAVAGLINPSRIVKVGKYALLISLFGLLCNMYDHWTCKTTSNLSKKRS